MTTAARLDRANRPTRAPGRIRRAALFIGLGCALVGIGLLRLPAAESLETSALDLLFLVRGTQRPTAPVCIVALDDDSHSALGVPRAGPWPRSLHARLIRTLTAAGAKVIAFDVLFADGDPSRADDRELAQAIAESGNVVLAERTALTDDPAFREVHTERPFAAFAAAARAVGEISLPAPGRAGVMRTTWLGFDGRPSLAFAAYRVGTGDTSAPSEDTRLIDYYGPARTIPTVSFYQALDAEHALAPGYFRGKLVFVGRALGVPGAAMDQDMFFTPFRGPGAAPMHGVEIHATIAANLFEHRTIELLSGVVESALLLLCGVLAAWSFLSLRPLAGAAVLGVFVAALWAAGAVAFRMAHTWIPLAIPTLFVLPMAYVAALGWRYVAVMREREKIRRAFAHYVSADMLERVVAGAETLRLGGAEIEGTALLTDIQGFTTLAEPLAAHETAEFLNAYFSAVSGAIFAEEGTLMKFVGDSVFAIWGAPVPVEDHAARACRAALAIAERTRGMRSASGAPLITRIGVHTGRMVVGNLGSAVRFDYTAIGDTINVVSRLEGLNRSFGAHVLTSRATLDRAGKGFSVRRLGRVRLAGRQEPIEVVELLGVDGGSFGVDAAAIARFESAHAAFVAHNFADAARGFREVLTRAGGVDGPAEFYAQLCERMLNAPPPLEWDGVIELGAKS